MSGGFAMLADWQGTLNAPTAGNYTFKVASEGQTQLLIDGQMVADAGMGTQDLSAFGNIDLTEGAHTFQLRYNWNGGSQVLDLYWQPPGAMLELMPPGVLTTDGGAWLPGTVPDPAPFQFQEGK
jgi:hypothetical protein